MTVTRTVGSAKLAEWNSQQRFHLSALADCLNRDVCRSCYWQTYFKYFVFELFVLDSGKGKDNTFNRAIAQDL